MSEKEQEKLKQTAEDDALKSALSADLAEELPSREEAVAYIFSPDFEKSIRGLIEHADQIAEGRTAEEAAAAETAENAAEEKKEEIKQKDQAEEIKQADRAEEGDQIDQAKEAEQTAQTDQTDHIKETDQAGQEALGGPKAAEKKAPAAEPPSGGRGRSRAEHAQDQMNEKILPMSFLQKHRKAIVNAASVVLVFGIGVFFLKEGGSLLGSSGKNAAQTEAETSAPPAGEEAAPQSAGADAAGQPGTNAETSVAAASLDEDQEAAAPASLAPETSGSGAENAQASAASDGASHTGDAADDAAGSAAGERSAAGEESRTGEAAAEGEPAESAAAAQGSAQTGRKKENSGQKAAETKKPAESGASSNTKPNTKKTGAGQTPSTKAGDRSSSKTGGDRRQSSAAQTTKAAPAETARARAGAEAQQTQAANSPSAETSGALTADTAEGGAAAGLQESTAAQLANPIKAVSDPKEFEKQLGFMLAVYPAAAEQEDVRYSIIADRLAQIEYFSETIDSEVVYRAEKKDVLLAELPEEVTKPEDDGKIDDAVWQRLSGIYYPFDEKRTEIWTVRGRDGQPDTAITVRMVNSESAQGALATWEKDGLLCSLWVKDASRHRNAVGKEAKNLVELSNEAAPLG